MTFQNVPLALSFDDILLVPQKSLIETRNDISLATQISENFKIDIPIVAINMDTVTGVDMATEISKKGGVAFLPRFDNPQVQAEKITKIKNSGQRVIAALGLRDDSIQRAEICVRAGADGLTIDVAHGHMNKCIKTTSMLKNRFPNLPIISGVVATYDGAYDLFAAGADSVRVGVGSGTICITRIVTGCGVPQATAISEAFRASKKFKNRFVLADGGAKNSGDITKALALGASAVVVGSLLAGTDEAPGKVIKKNGNYYKEYNGSTSLKEKQNQIEKDNGHKPNFILHIEGVEALVKYKGPVSNILDELCAGIRSGLSYCGARDIKLLHKKAKFIRITPAGMSESRSHSVEVVND